MSDYSFIDNLVASHEANPVALAMHGKTLYPYLGIVTANDDPLGFRRLKTTKRGNPRLSTDWLIAAEWTYVDGVLPRIGDTVLVLSVEGDDGQGVYLPIVNRRRAPDAGQENPQDDATRYVPGDEKTVVGGDALHAVGEQLRVRSRFELHENDVRHTVRSPIIEYLSPYGEIIINATGVIFRPGSAGVIRINAENRPVEFTNCTSVTINGEEIATVGAVDSAGHPLVTRGW